MNNPLITVTDLTIDITRVLNSELGIAHLSLIPSDHSLGSWWLDQQHQGNTWFYFNRLFVAKKIRGRGIATEIMQQIIRIADEKQITIYCPVNPYGHLNLRQCIKFYSKYGFEQIGERTVIRKPVAVEATDTACQAMLKIA